MFVLIQTSTLPFFEWCFPHSIPVTCSLADATIVCGLGMEGDVKNAELGHFLKIGTLGNQIFKSAMILRLFGSEKQIT